MLSSDERRRSIRHGIYGLLTGGGARDAARNADRNAGIDADSQPRNFLTHVVALTATKTGDAFVDPKLVLSWILGALGAPVFLIGLLVPIRESLALLPQMLTAPRIRSLPVRKVAWAAGSAVQGAAVFAMGLAVLTLDGITAGLTVVGLLALFAVARSVCSVSYKDVLGKTVVKSTRGTATGTAGSIAAIGGLGLGASLSFGIVPLTVPSLAIFLLIAAALWVLAAMAFMTLDEEPGTAGEDGATQMSFLAQLSYIRRDPQFARFIAVRSLLTATALAPPFMVAIAGAGGESVINELGPFVIASTLAAIVSNYVWGRLADRSSRGVLIIAGLSGAAATASVAMTAWLAPALAANTLIMSAMLFFLMVAYQGVRLGRSTHLVDMTGQDRRAVYTAVSNTIIGVVLLFGGFFGVLSHLAGNTAVLAVFAVMCLAAAWLAHGLDEVQAESHSA